MSSHDDPDYRMSLAAERTYLAYLRTSLALCAAGVAVAGALPDAGALTLRRALGAFLITIGAGVAIESRRRLRAIEYAMRHDQPLPGTERIQLVSWLLVSVAVAAIAVVVLA